jgi:hypothetical protein
MTDSVGIDQRGRRETTSTFKGKGYGMPTPAAPLLTAWAEAVSHHMI